MDYNDSFLPLVLPLIAVLIAQISKFFIKSNKIHLNLKNMSAYSGMPSAHAALTVSLTTIIALLYGILSPLFAICLIFTMIIIKDAVGLRQYLGQHGKILNTLVKDLDEDDLLDKKYPPLLEKIGHTPMQVLAGAVLGFFVSILGYFITYT